MTLDHRSPPFKPGDEVCRVKIQRLVGRGGQGFVYEGIHQFLKKPVAIKAIPNTLDSTRNLRERAEREAGILFDLQHPNVLRVTDADVTDDGVVCIVMEMLKGRSIRALLHELHRVRVDEALLIGAQIADGVQAAHERQTIHRDLKPENVYIEPGNIAKVLDFGIAKILGPGAVTTQENLIQGTLQYMSPEHLQARPVTARSDVFALGCILYELLSGSTPSVIGLEGVTVQLAGWNQIMLIPPRLDAVVENIPASVARAIQLMLAKEPDERPASMKAVAQELRALRAKYAMATACPARELWHSGAGAAPPIVVLSKLDIATATIPDAADPRGQAAPQAVGAHGKPAQILESLQGGEPTKPLPLLVRSDSKSQQLTVAPRDDSLVFQTLPEPPDALADAASESDLAASPRRNRPVQAAGPVSAPAQASVPRIQLGWPSVAIAAVLGVTLGLTALLVASSMADRETARPVASASASVSAAAPPIVPAVPVTPPEVIASAVVESATETPPASSTALVGSSPAPQLPRKQTRPDASSVPSTTPGAAVSAKPAVRRPKKAVPKNLPFTGDDLTF